MKSLQKVISLLVAICMLLGLLAACGGSSTTSQKKDDTSKASTQDNVTTAADEEPAAKFGELKLKVLGGVQTGNKTPTQDVLTPIWREKTKVIPEIIAIPPGQDSLQWLQMQVVSSNLPDVIAVTNGIFDNPQIYDYLRKEGVLKELKLDDMKNYLPRIAKRFEKLTVTIDEWYAANVDVRDNKLWYIPSAPNPNMSKEVRDLPWHAGSLGPTPYSMYMRDDILKKIFPNVKTEAELKQVFAEKGELTPEDINDIPIKNAEDLYQYLKKVKELGIKVGEKEVIPAHPMCNADVGSLMWSMFSFPGFWWRDLVDRFYVNSEMIYFAGTPEWKEYIKWMNQCYNEDLFGKEIFIQKDDQREAKVINGEYAVFQRWNNVQGARDKSVKENRGYGFRVLYTFPNSLKTKYQDATREIYQVQNNWGAIAINKNVSDDKIPQILNWIDWNGSEEAAELRAWGTPNMYTGDKENRRYKPEYKELEAYAVTGKQGGDKDGYYYGLYMRESGQAVGWNHETYGLCSSGEWAYVYTPKDVYPRDASSVDIGDISDEAMRAFYQPQLKFYKQKTSTKEYMAQELEFKKLDEPYQAMKKTAGLDADGAKVATVKAIVGKPEDFDKNYTAYRKFLTAEYVDSLKQQAPVYGKLMELREMMLEELK